MPCSVIRWSQLENRNCFSPLAKSHFSPPGMKNIISICSSINSLVRLQGLFCMKSHYDKSHHLRAWHHSKRQLVQQIEMKRTKSLGCRLCGAMGVAQHLLRLRNSICNFPQTNAKPGILELGARRKGSNSKKIWKIKKKKCLKKDLIINALEDQSVAD